jgi:hypothetical protein
MLRARLQARLLSLLLLCRLASAYAAELHIYSGDSFESAVENLNAGDILTVHEGTYVDPGRISIRVKGTAKSPVTIQAAAGDRRPLITRADDDRTQNTINIYGAEFLTIRGIEISSNGGDGINLSGDPSFITLDDLVIHDIAVGINLRSNMRHIAVRNSHIYRTNGTGEGMYIGCNHARCVVSDSIFESNWIHDTVAATQGDGIEVKRGSHSIIIRNNVIHDTNWPCILLYGTNGNPRNVVEGNVMWNCGEAGIQVAADTIIRNNIILESPGVGIVSHAHQGVSPGNLEILHNTLVTTGPCLRLRHWADTQNIVFANNAIYCSPGSIKVGRLKGVVVSGNVFWSVAGGFSTKDFTLGRSEAQDFVDTENRNVYPSWDSALLGIADPAFAASQDFNGKIRNGDIDAGAYEWSSTQNPGWQVAPGFKGCSPSANRCVFGRNSLQQICKQDLNLRIWFSNCQ